MNAHFFRVDYSSAFSGFALFVMVDGKVCGTDVGGIQYQGTYSLNGDIIEADIVMNVPAGAHLVTGPVPTSESIPINVNFDSKNSSQQYLELPTGKVGISITPLY
ncbi:hypothetical protein [Vibrio parahaemolyticus]|uniref:hypothetical protein n=1 Tax=Vibrio parahaemolyticus TaxID=670 RepID=UPI0007A08B3C|nr:hypothetical protein [Vibrio parahaemolyticus]ELE6596803.1 hypothetical protein [Vibrio alginolyticus]KYX82287.1 hypothetical protein AVP39_17260 [Vibrio parahaemolyticus]HCZ9266416.1 hypothetical protein [Vibrio alginolyticus]